MDFHEKYTTDNTIKGDEQKTLISKEAFAVCEMLSILITKLGKLKL